MMRRSCPWLLGCLPAVLGGLPAWLCAALVAQDPTAADQLARPNVWTPGFVEAMATQPVQESGRPKPLSSFAASTLYAVHGRRDMKLDLDGDGKPDVTLTPVEWLLDVWCFPEQAAKYPLFRIENVEVLDAIGIPLERGQRFDFEYVTFEQLVTPGKVGVPAQRLIELAHKYDSIAAVKRSPVESHIVVTAERLDTYFRVHRQLQILGQPFALEGELRARLGGMEKTDLATLVEKGPQFIGLVREYENKMTDPAIRNALEIAAVLEDLVGARETMALFPPAGTVAENDRWLGLGELVQRGLFDHLQPEQTVMLQHLQQGLITTDQATRERELLAFRDAVVSRATARGEYDKVPLEHYYLDASWHYKALHWFLLALVVVALGWTMPRSKWMWLAGIASTVVPWVFLVIDIVLRCVIRGRPPILNLYDTFLFVAAIGVGAAVVAEIITRRRFVLSVAPIFGALLIALARAFEVEDGKDQLAPLQAVLDTNYYLATHVTSINIGYAASMFASFVGTAWLLMQTIGVRRNDTAFHKSIVRATYGLVAFGLIFAVFGTIYGGVWANDSWGRFWGWDPKENGAFLICIALVSLMHARMCGWVRDFGFCVGAALTGIVVAFSWFHVNLLGIGLHAYGFASSTKNALFIYYGVQLGLIGVGVAGVLIRRALAAAEQSAMATAGK
ncbi:MAG TPA: cytochrome c biogenesis protein CcsA [Planctomycetota bacterium]|nr:cytochrome c biogenesis protein CcsA [Planctomycetota bacterium]